MNFSMKSYFLLTHTILVIIACQHEDFETYFRPEVNYELYPDYDYYVEATTSVQHKNITHRIITCSHLNSTESVVYQYSDENFDQYLKIENSNILSVKKSAFVTFTTIAKLYLENVHIQTISPGAFSGLTHLKELHLDHNELTEVSNGVFNSLPSLEVLTLNDNKIHKIENMAFTGVDTLITLHLQNNKIENIGDDVFKDQKRLKHLNLSNNPLVNFSMASLLNLENLFLSNTSLEKFDYNLSYLTLSEINIKSSRLSEVNFANFPKLTNLDLSSNSIKNLTNCENLDSTNLNLSHNAIRTIDGPFKTVLHFDMSHNELTVIENSVFNGSDRINSIDFSFNKILTINKFAFQNLASLEKLFLRHNSISEIDLISFKGLISLNVLDLSHNRIEHFQLGTFDSLSYLEVLDISNNKLTDLHQYTFHSLTKLRTLFFHNNQISTLNVDDLKNHHHYLRSVSLDKNLFNCQELVKIGHSFNMNSVYVIPGHSYDTENFHGIACQNKKGFKVSKEDFTKSVADSIKSSEIENDFEENFQKSKFFKFFNNDFRETNFFKYFSGYQFNTVGNQNLNSNKIEKLTSVQVVADESGKSILIFSLVTQVIIVFILLSGAYFMLRFLKRKTFLSSKAKTLSQIELL